MMESGATVAAQRLADMDVDLAIAGFAHHMLVFDPAAGHAGVGAHDPPASNSDVVKFLRTTRLPA